jgi:signal transduction histidine kinase
LRKRWPAKTIAAYVGLVAAALAIALIAGWTGLAARIDNYAYDFFFNLYPPAPEQPQSAVLAVDEDTLVSMGGPRHIRTILAEGLERIAPVHPRAVAIDFILADPGEREENERLARALSGVRNVVLSCELVPGGWEDPIAPFRAKAAALGHVHAEKNPLDGISRILPLEKASGGDRRWALSLEAFRLAKNSAILESPGDLQVGDTVIPAPHSVDERPLRIRYQRAGSPTWSIRQLVSHPALADNFRDKTVFIGYTALSYVRDRLFNPYGDAIQGVVIHAQAFETMQHRQFLVPASDLTVLGFCILLAIAAAANFAFLSGWPPYLNAAALLVCAHALPAVFFRHGIVFPYFISISTSWLPITTAAAFQYFVVRRALRKSESDKARYQQAIHFVTHEMRTPLTAIQGSSELMGRYNLTDEKRQQMASMINSESKRLAGMIQTFLDVERLTEGQIDLKREVFPVRHMIRACLERVRPIAEHKQIAIQERDIGEAAVTGDRELMEYAFYNLLTNAVKYSPAGRQVFVDAVLDHGSLRLAVKDQGIGIDAKELSNIFRKFYRTRKAEASGEVGTGIGLSIVEQIVIHHGGRMEVTSTPGQGSTFTMVVPAQARVPSEDIAV